MFEKKATKIYKSKVNDLIDNAGQSDSEEKHTVLQEKYGKDVMYSAIRELSNDREQLLKLQTEMNNIGEPNMDEKDLKILTSDLSKLLDEKFEKKFSVVENDLQAIKENSEKTCTSGDCFADKLDDLDKKISDMGTIKEEFTDFKSNVSTEISKVNTGLVESISEINEKLNDTCTGVDCIKERLSKEDDMVECTNCNHTFSLSENSINDNIICPNCGVLLEFE